MKKMCDIPEIDRPVNKAITKGPAVLSNTELLEAVIGNGNGARDVREISRDINRLFNETKGIPSLKELASISGLGDSRAVQILACYEMGRRYFAPKEAQTVTRPEDCLPALSYIRDKKQEHFVVITLNGAGEILGNRIITLGLLNHSLVHPREVFADAITDRAASIICAHNHPSGSLEPSSQDIAITTQLKEAGSILGIQLIDHLIITKNAHVSMRERGLV
jgi:DNA repair protein RadC